MNFLSSLSKSLNNSNRYTKIIFKQDLNKLFQVRFGTSIPVVLIDDIENRGEKGDIITVKRGFARNYLIPRKLAGIKICSIHFE